MSRRGSATAVAALVSLLLAAAALVAVELGQGATRYGSGGLANPCHPRTFTGSGLDATIQQTVLHGLDGAACRLGISREQLVLSLASGGSHPPHWDAHTIEIALRAGVVAAADDALKRGALPNPLAPLIRDAIQHAPLDQIVRGAITIGNLLS
jgi:hypothetical protein